MTFPILSEKHSAGVPGILHMPMAAENGPSGHCNCFNPDYPLDGLVDGWCGPDDRFAWLWARRLALMPEGQRWGQLGGGFGNVYAAQEHDQAYRAAHRAATVEAIGRHVRCCRELGFEPDGVWVDDETGEAARNAADLFAILYESLVLSIKRTRCVCWNVYEGLGEARNMWGSAQEVAGVVDRRTALVTAYFEVNAGTRPGWSAAEQVEAIVGQATRARGLGLDFAVLATGATHDQSRKPYTQEFAGAYADMARRTAELGPVAVITAPTGGQGEPPLCDPGVDYAAPPIGRTDLIPGNVPVVLEESLATVRAWRG